jgi:hypothetical protein
MAPDIYKYILHNFAISEKLAQLLNCHILVPFITWTAGTIHSDHVCDTYTDCTGTEITDSDSENVDM